MHVSRIFCEKQKCQHNWPMATQSIGMLSFTFLRQIGHYDIVVPMIDYEVGDGEAWKMTKSTLKDWGQNSETIQSWCPYANEEELFDQFQFAGMKDHGMRIVLYNLWRTIRAIWNLILTQIHMIFKLEELIVTSRKY